MNIKHSNVKIFQDLKIQESFNAVTLIIQKIIWRYLLLRLFTLLRKKKRAISPVISVILLIGLAVAASALIFLVVIPLLTPKPDLEMQNAYIEYDDEHTTAADEGVGYGKGTVMLYNGGTAKSEVNSIKVYNSTSVSSGNWTEIINAVSLQSITTSNTREINPVNEDEITIRFPIPEGNYDNSMLYKIVVGTKEGKTLDSSSDIEETTLQLTKDRPDISFTGSLNYIRRTQTISPTSVSDNSAIKNVTYEVLFPNGSLALPPQAITSSLWSWSWNSRNLSSILGDADTGLSNGDYSLNMTVYDYAGLSDSADTGSFTIDNDYINPNFTGIVGSSVENGDGIAEVGSSFTINANITDTGSAVSAVDSAYLYYKFNDSSTTYSTTSMLKTTGNTWTGNIPGPFLDSESLVHNITYYLVATDDDSNEVTSVDQFADVIDTTEPNFESHVFESEAVTTQDTLEGTEGQTLSLAVTVTDKDAVNNVNLYWRERNDTQIPTQYGPWTLTSNISGTSDAWDFRIPALNVTLNGVEYFFNATDPYNNTAWEGTPASPYRILIPDEIVPVIDIQSTMPSSIVEGTPLIVTAGITDNDPTFSWTGFETGTVKLTVIKPVLPDPEYDMIHISGDSSQGETPIWDLTVLGGNFSTTYSPVTIRIQATDQKGKTIILDNSITVMDAGLPLIDYVSDSVSVSGADNHILSFNIKNADGAATATITDIQILLQSNGKTILSGEPYFTQIDESGTVWTNSTPTEGANGTKITLSSTFDLSMGSTTTLQLTYANSTSGNYDLYDLTVTVTLYYDYPVGQSGQRILESFNTPVTQLIPTTETRYMRSGTATVNGLTAYDFGTSLSGSIHLSDPTNTYSSDLSTTWGMQVYVLHADSSQTPISGGTVATVQRPAGGSAAGIQSNTWNCPETSLVATDAIVVEIWGQVGGNSPELHAEFVTGQLGAEQLDSATWIVHYYTERDRSGGFFSRRTTAIFHWGEGIYNSRIEGIKYSSAGGGGASIQAILEISNNSLTMDPSSPMIDWATEMQTTIWFWRPRFTC